MPNSKKSAQTTNSTGPLILIAIGIVLILIVLILSLFNAQTNGDQVTGLQPTAANDIPYPEIARISLDDARSAFDSQTALFIDVRDAESYAQKHIPGSINHPLDQLESQVPKFDANILLIPYCTWPAEQSSARAARLLLDAGYTNVKPLLGGFGAWMLADYPVEP